LPMGVRTAERIKTSCNDASKMFSLSDSMLQRP
jgi:hypothetical protein